MKAVAHPWMPGPAVPRAVPESRQAAPRLLAAALLSLVLAQALVSFSDAAQVDLMPDMALPHQLLLMLGLCLLLRARRAGGGR